MKRNSTIYKFLTEYQVSRRWIYFQIKKYGYKPHKLTKPQLDHLASLSQPLQRPPYKKIVQVYFRNNKDIKKTCMILGIELFQLAKALKKAGVRHG